MNTEITLTDKQVDIMMSSPALKTKILDRGYPYGNKVPKMVRMVKYAISDIPFNSIVADLGKTYPVWVNSYGAVAIIHPDGTKLGVRPSEFEVVEFHQ